MNRYNKPVFNGISTKHDRKKEAEMLKVLSKPSSEVSQLYMGNLCFVKDCSG